MEATTLVAFAVAADASEVLIRLVADCNTALMAKLAVCILIAAASPDSAKAQTSFASTSPTVPLIPSETKTAFLAASVVAAATIVDSGVTTT